MLFPAASRPRLACPASAFPEHVVDAARATETLQRLFPDEDPLFVAQLVRRSGVETRALARPPETLFEGEAFGARNDAYREVALGLALQASWAALARAELAAAEVDVVVDVSCTGICLPALDVVISPALGLRDDCLRLPVAESGCAAGALGLALASRLAAAGSTVLVVAVELCSLTLVPEDRSRANLISGVLFGDGAAAAVVRPPDAPGVPIRAAGSHLFPGTADVMGFDVGERGLGIVLSKELPRVLELGLGDAIDAFLAHCGRTRADVGRHWIHPGGRRVLETYANLFELGERELGASRESLRRNGKLSSASILTVLQLGLDGEGLPGDAKDAFVLGVGPGLSAEMLLLGESA